nr:uncharacterized protein LOC109157601 [Ipomoea batatas]
MAMIACIWNDICEKLKETPAESVSSFKGSVEKQLQLMKHNGDSDGQITLLEEAIKEAEKTIKEAEKTIKDSREELTMIRDERPKLRDERPKLQELVTKAQEQRNTSQEETPMLTDEDEDKLSLAKKDLEAEKEGLMNFRIV